MHYTQIAQSANHLGLTRSTGTNVAISFSSVLSKDIRTNPSSPFVKKARGIYGLSPARITNPKTPSLESSIYSEQVERLKLQAGLTDDTALARKALYFAGRSLDTAAESGDLSYSNLDNSLNVNLNLKDVLQEITAESEDGNGYREFTNSAVQSQLNRLSRRLGIHDTEIALQFALCLLGLALKITHDKPTVNIRSEHRTVKLAVRSARSYGIACT